MDDRNVVSGVRTNQDRRILSHLIERAKSNYMCNRGPQPSGAMFASAVVTRDGAMQRIIKYGDVTPTINSPSCKDEGCMMEDGHCVRNIHAEVDALLAAAREGIPTSGGIMYSINKPCFNCTKACIKAGIVKIIYAFAVYDEPRTQQITEAAGVEVLHVTVD